MILFIFCLFSVLQEISASDFFDKQCAADLSFLRQHFSKNEVKEIEEGIQNIIVKELKNWTNRLKQHVINEGCVDLTIFTLSGISLFSTFATTINPNYSGGNIIIPGSIALALQAAKMTKNYLMYKRINTVLKENDKTT